MYVFEIYKVNALQYMQQNYPNIRHKGVMHGNKCGSVCSSKHNGYECNAYGSDNIYDMGGGGCLTDLTKVNMFMYFKNVLSSTILLIISMCCVYFQLSHVY